MSRPGYRTLFLGDRRIAWSILQHLMAPGLSGVFDLRGLVTGEEMERRFRAEADVLPPVILRNDARHSDALRELISNERVDLILSIQHNWILPDDILASVDGRAFNLHNAKLPDYKGYNSVSHAILNGDETYVSTVHRMVAEVDAGPIVVEGHTPIKPEDTALSLYERSLSAATNAVLDLLNRLADGGEIEETPMAAGDGAFYRRDSLAALADLSSCTDAEAYDRRARALFFPPLNVAFHRIGGQRYFIVPESGHTDVLARHKPVNHDYD